MRFFYHPLEDKFSLINGWKDPAWTNAKIMREGLDADERDSRERLFERNAIEISQKTIPQLLVDEVGLLFLCLWLYLTISGLPPLLHLPSCKFASMVHG
jgi:hypothetical protein